MCPITISAKLPDWWHKIGSYDLDILYPQSCIKKSVHFNPWLCKLWRHQLNPHAMAASCQQCCGLVAPDVVVRPHPAVPVYQLHVSVLWNLPGDHVNAAFRWHILERKKMAKKCPSHPSLDSGLLSVIWMMLSSTMQGANTDCIKITMEMQNGVIRWTGWHGGVHTSCFWFCKGKFLVWKLKGFN